MAARGDGRDDRAARLGGARSWVVATVATAVLAASVWLLPRRWHQLARRWFVLVPAGAVVHDPVVLADTLMLPRASVASIALDPDGAARRRATDLSGPTPGIGVELRLAGATTAVLAATPREPTGRTIQFTALVVTPTRPGAVLARRPGQETRDAVIADVTPKRRTGSLR